MYLRFKTQFINNEDKPQYGIFHAMEYVEGLRDTSIEDELRLKELYKWFKSNLDVPKHFHDDAITYGWEGKSLSWFKDSAKEHIKLIREAVSILEKYNLIVETVWATNPGQVVYEDEFQVSAIPYGMKPRIVK